MSRVLTAVIGLTAAARLAGAQGLALTRHLSRRAVPAESLQARICH
jgi:hypothetical protein